MALHVLEGNKYDLFWRETNSAIQTNHFAIEHVVFQNVFYQFGIVIGRAQAAREGHCRSQSVLYLLGHAKHHGGAKNAGRNGHVANAVAR